MWYGKPLYRRKDGAFHIAWDDVCAWDISITPGIVYLGCWIREDENVVGDYYPLAPYTGAATVTEI